MLDNISRRDAAFYIGTIALAAAAPYLIGCAPEQQNKRRYTGEIDSIAAAIISANSDPHAELELFQITKFETPSVDDVAIALFLIQDLQKRICENSTD